MFTVKATYRNETRKFTFPDSSQFPSFEELYDQVSGLVAPAPVVADTRPPQLYRVFGISPSFYLSQILFSPNASHSPTSQRILLGREAHSSDEYDEHIAPYRARSWPGAVLKFSVHDATPHKSPTTSSNRISMLSTDSGHASLTSEGASSVTVVDWEHAPLSLPSRGDERKLFLERLRERTNTRTNGSPPSEPIVEPSQLISTGSSQDSSTSRQSFRPLPRRPSLSDDTDSAASTTTRSSKTARPSLYDLLNREPSSSSRSTARAESSRPSLADVLRQDLAALSAHQDAGEDSERSSAWPIPSINIDVVPPSPSAVPDAAHIAPEERPALVSQDRRRNMVAPPRAWDDETVVPRPLSERLSRPRPISDRSSLRNGTTHRAQRPSLVELMREGPSAGTLRSHHERRSFRERIESLTKVSSEAVARARNQFEEDMAIVIPPLPILSPSDIHIGQSPTFIVPPPPILYPSVGMTLPGQEAMISAVPQSDAPPQSPGWATAPITADIGVAAPPSCDGLPSRDTDCCSVAQGKAEVHTLINRFVSDLEVAMKKTFGEEWSMGDALEGAGHDCAHKHAAPHRSQSGCCRNQSYSMEPCTTSLPSPRGLSVQSPPDIYAHYVPVNGPKITQSVCAMWSPGPVEPRIPSPMYTGYSRTSSPLYSPVVPPTPPEQVRQPIIIQPPLPMSYLQMSRAFTPVVPPPPDSWVPPTSSPIHSPPAHPGITCDGCRRINFYGIRYKCMDCYGMPDLLSLSLSATVDVAIDFDLCAECMNSVDIVEKHLQHTFRPVIDSRATQQNTHTGSICDGCGRRNIFGVRHRCLECDGA